MKCLNAFSVSVWTELKKINISMCKDFIRISSNTGHLKVISNIFNISISYNKIFISNIGENNEILFYTRIEKPK